MHECNILHLIKDTQLVGIVTPDSMGMDHIFYPAGTPEEVQKEILQILTTVPIVSTLEQRKQAIKDTYSKKGYVVEDVVM